MAQGTVKWFDGGRGYGFIAVEGGPDVFMHVRAITGGAPSLAEGQQVEFDITQRQKGPQAQNRGRTHKTVGGRRERGFPQLPRIAAGGPRPRASRGAPRGPRQTARV